MRIEKREAVVHGKNVFGQYVTQYLGFEKIYYIMSQNEFETAELPDGQYGVCANELIKSHIEFKEWEDEADCKWCIFDVKNGVKSNFKDVCYEVYKAELEFVIFE